MELGGGCFMSNTEVIKTLNDLIETCRDRQDGFREAAGKMRTSEFRRLFNIFSQQRAQFMSELQAEVRRLGGEPADRGGIGADPPLRMLRYRAAAGEADEARVIAECEEAEGAAVNSYQEALRADMPLDVQYVVKRQYMDVKD